MQKWPYADFGYVNVEHLHHKPQTWEYRIVEAVFSLVSENTVMFFDHYTNEMMGQRSELDRYLEKLAGEGWKLNLSLNVFQEKGYQFRRYQFRRALE